MWQLCVWEQVVANVPHLSKNESQVGELSLKVLTAPWSHSTRIELART